MLLLDVGLVTYILLGIFRYGLFYFIMFNLIIQSAQIKARTNLYASRKVLEILTPFNKRIKELWNKYYNLFESENALEELQNCKYEAELEGNVSDDQVERKFQLEADMYEEKNLISGEEIADVLERLSKQVREELKTER
jgi:hypothetical protein